LLRALNIPIAVITNASLIWRPDVRAELCKADWVSLKVDAVAEATWRWINRPHGALSLKAILDGALEFASAFTGELATETMLVAGVNDTPSEIEEVASFVARLRPATAYLAIPTRPPAERWVRPPDEETLNYAYQIFRENVTHVEYLIGYEGNAFAYTGNVAADLLAITAMHPMRKDAVDIFLTRAGADWTVVDALIAQEELVATDMGGERFSSEGFGSQSHRTRRR
jgi:wyosine [tRNA(Phe)-imidazoG37] synthetase (radical SAM superfamily)